MDRDNSSCWARDRARCVRSSGSPVPDLVDAVGDLGQAIWALAVSFDDSGRRDESRRLPLRAARLATKAVARHVEVTLIEIAGQVRINRRIQSVVATLD